MAVYLQNYGEQHITVKYFIRQVVTRLAFKGTQLWACGWFLFLVPDGFETFNLISFLELSSTSGLSRSRILHCVNTTGCPALFRSKMFTGSSYELSLLLVL